MSRRILKLEGHGGIFGLLASDEIEQAYLNNYRIRCKIWIGKIAANVIDELMNTFLVLLLSFRASCVHHLSVGDVVDKGCHLSAGPLLTPFHSLNHTPSS